MSSCGLLQTICCKWMRVIFVIGQGHVTKVPRLASCTTSDGFDNVFGQSCAVQQSSYDLAWCTADQICRGNRTLCHQLHMQDSSPLTRVDTGMVEGMSGYCDGDPVRT